MIYVRKGRLLTKEELEKHEEKLMRAWQEEKTRTYLGRLGLSLEAFNKRRKEMIKSGISEPNDIDIIMSLFNEQVATEKDYGKLSSSYYELALILEEEGREYFHVLKLSSIMRLKELRKQGWKEVEILSCGCCSYCESLNGKRLTIEQALKELPIPHRDCPHENTVFCTCSYEPAGELPIDKF